jgi:hypothetical protein
MRDVVYALVAIVAGGVFCFWGYLAFRVVIPIWGAFVGFSLGAGLAAGIGDGGFLGDAVGWIVAIACALLFGLAAYFFFQVAVVLAMASIGFALGASVMFALGVDWTWLVVLVGVVVGVGLAFLALVTDLPMLLLIVLSALGGASAVTTGVMLLTGTLNSSDLDTADVTDQISHGWWWYAIYGVLAVAGLVVQLRSANQRQASLREAWDARASDARTRA